MQKCIQVTQLLEDTNNSEEILLLAEIKEGCSNVYG